MKVMVNSITVLIHHHSKLTNHRLLRCLAEFTIEFLNFDESFNLNEKLLLILLVLPVEPTAADFSPAEHAIPQAWLSKNESSLETINRYYERVCKLREQVYKVIGKEPNKDVENG